MKLRGYNDTHYPRTRCFAEFLHLHLSATPVRTNASDTPTSAFSTVRYRGAEQRCRAYLGGDISITDCTQKVCRCYILKSTSASKYCKGHPTTRSRACKSSPCRAARRSTRCIRPSRCETVPRKTDTERVMRAFLRLPKWSSTRLTDKPMFTPSRDIWNFAITNVSEPI